MRGLTYFLIITAIGLTAALYRYGTHAIEYFNAINAEMFTHLYKTVIMLAVYFITYKLRIHWDKDFDFSTMVQQGGKNVWYKWYAINIIAIVVIIVIGFW